MKTTDSLFELLFECAEPRLQRRLGVSLVAFTFVFYFVCRFGDLITEDNAFLSRGWFREVIGVLVILAGLAGAILLLIGLNPKTSDDQEI